jgi:hypothetical protein
MDALLKDLRAISISGGYKHDVKQAKEVEQPGATISGGEMPFIGVTEAEELYDWKPHDCAYITVTFEIHGYVDGEDAEHRRRNLHDLRDDILAKTMDRSNTLLKNSAVAYSAKVLRMEPTYFPDEKQGHVTIDLEVKYQRCTAVQDTS